jgi:hypothetical protein
MGHIARQARQWRDDLLQDPELSGDWRNWQRVSHLVCQSLERPQRPSEDPRQDTARLRDAPLETLDGNSQTSLPEWC